MKEYIYIYIYKNEGKIEKTQEYKKETKEEKIKKERSITI